VALGINEKCDVRQWADLDKLERRYDYVMCRGNSLVYAQTWDGSTTVADESCFVDALVKMASVIEPGGYLHIDAPESHALELNQSATPRAPVHYAMPSSRWRPSRVHVTESVEERGQKRIWACKVEVRYGLLRSRSLSFRRYSGRLTMDALEPLLFEAGFDGIERLQLRGDRRSGHATVLARRR
jgi:hypothetical protein